MRAMTRLASAAMAVGMLAASVIAAHAATGTNPAHTQASVKITAAGTLTFALGGGTAYTSKLNIGGTTSVTCNQNPTYSGSPITTATSAMSASFTSVSTTKQVVYVFCMDQYTVKDLRGTGTGWHVTITAGPWTCKTTVSKGCTAGTAMGSSIFFMDVPVATCSAAESCTGPSTLPALKMTASKPIDVAGGVIVASAAVNTGMGVFNFAPRTDQCASSQQCYTSTGTLVSGAASNGQLDLYPPTTAKTGTYTSTLTESVVAGP